MFTNDYVAAGNDGYTLLGASPTIANLTSAAFPQIVSTYLVRAPRVLIVQHSQTEQNQAPPGLLVVAAPLHLRSAQPGSLLLPAKPPSSPQVGGSPLGFRTTAARAVLSGPHKRRMCMKSLPTRCSACALHPSPLAQGSFSPVSPATDGRIVNCLLTGGIPACGPVYKTALGAQGQGCSLQTSDC